MSEAALEVAAATPVVDVAEKATVQNQPSETAANPEAKDLNGQRHARVFNDIARREKALRSQQAEIESKMQSQKDAFELVQMFKENPLAALEKAGLSYEQLTQMQLQKLYPDKPEVQFTLLNNKFKELEESIKKKETDQVEQYKAYRAKAEQEAIATFQNQIKDTIAKSEKHELLRAVDNDGSTVQEIYQYIEDHFKKTGELLELETVLDQAESVLEEQLTEKILQTNKIKAKVGASMVKSTKDNESPKKPSRVTPAAVATITNKLNSSSGLATEQPVSFAEAKRLLKEKFRNS